MAIHGTEDRQFSSVNPPSKSRHRRTPRAPLPPQLEERLRAGRAWEGAAWGGLVFADEVGTPLSACHAIRRFKALLASANFPPMRYHDLRHGAATLMAAQGVQARVAMELLGHSQISTTMNIYAHVAPELRRKAAERVGAALWGNS